VSGAAFGVAGSALSEGDSSSGDTTSTGDITATGTTNFATGGTSGTSSRTTYIAPGGITSNTRGNTGGSSGNTGASTDQNSLNDGTTGINENSVPDDLPAKRHIVQRFRVPTGGEAAAFSKNAAGGFAGAAVGVEIMNAIGNTMGLS
jgi:hypothetical protein